jgi:hypothetical protein
VSIRVEVLHTNQRDAGYQQLAVQLVPGHEDTMADWMEVFSRV